MGEGEGDAGDTGIGSPSDSPVGGMGVSPDGMGTDTADGPGLEGVTITGSGGVNPGVSGGDLAQFYDMGNVGPSVNNSLLQLLKNLALHVVTKSNPYGATLSTLAGLFGMVNSQDNNQIGQNMASMGVNTALANSGPIGQALASIGGGGMAVGAAANAGTGPAPASTTGGSNMDSTENLLSALFGLGLAGKAAGAYGGQMQDLQSLYGQNSPYAQMLRQQLMRQDAAHGRRSQAGSREVELQARLAELNSRNSPEIQKLTAAKYGAYASGLRDIMGWYKQGGRQDLSNFYNNYAVPAYNNLGNMFAGSVDPNVSGADLSAFYGDGA